MFKAKTVVTHIVLAFSAGAALLVSLILFILKVAEIGKGDEFSWMLIGGLFIGGVLVGALDVMVIFKNRPTSSEMLDQMNSDLKATDLLSSNRRLF